MRHNEGWRMKDEDERRMKDGVGNNEKTKKKQLKRQKKNTQFLG